MLAAHLDGVERQILAQAVVPGNAGHMVNRGTPREIFIREFLQEHLSQRVALGTGEIIGSDSRPREPRNQIDIVIFRSEFPKLNFGGGISAFLVESVVSTIEVKSLLTQDELEAAIRSASRIKRLSRHLQTTFISGWVPPNILSYVVAYAGPASMQTVYNWLAPIHGLVGVEIPALPINETRYRTPNPSIDAVFLLGTGFLYFDNAPLTLISDDERARSPDGRWIFCDCPTNNLLVMFMRLTQAVSGLTASVLNPLPYLERVRFPPVSFAP